MLSNLGLESEQRQGNARARGRRHFPRDETQGTSPTYITAPFAVQQEPSRNTPRQTPRQQQQRPPQEQYEQQYSDIVNHNYDATMMHENNNNNRNGYPMLSDAWPYQVNHQHCEQEQQYKQPQYGQPQQEQEKLNQSLRRERLSRGGLNIFSWNTHIPSAPLPRVVRERSEDELLRLRPTVKCGRSLRGTRKADFSASVRLSRVRRGRRSSTDDDVLPTLRHTNTHEPHTSPPLPEIFSTAAHT